MTGDKQRGANVSDNSGFLYDAFISYRHQSREMKAAVRLQQLLERYKMKESGCVRRLHIFRDQSELPTSGDLGGDIRTALEQSRFLIVICSPTYRESKWCMEEVIYFRSLHGQTNQNILPLLVEGEPEEAFPDLLCWEVQRGFDANNREIAVQVEVEPLGADIRAEGERQMLRLLRTEYLRIAAPILGCGFDDLYRRDQRRKRRNIITISTAATAAALTFGIYSSHMLNQIEQKQQELYENESLRLASVSEDALQSGDYGLALTLAQTALPDDLNNPDRPIVTEALCALQSAVMQYEVMEQYDAVQTQAYIDFNVSSFYICNVYAEGDKIAITDYDNVYLYDTENGALLFSCPGDETFFNKDATMAASIQRSQDDLFFRLYNTETGDFYYTGQYDSSASICAVWDNDEKICYLMEQQYSESNESLVILLEAVAADGEVISDAEVPFGIGDLYLEGYLYADSDPYSPDYDYNAEDGTVSERLASIEDGESYAKEIWESLSAMGYTIYGAWVTDDEEFLTFRIYETAGFSENGTTYSVAMMIVPFSSLREGEMESVILPGDCYLNRSNAVIYQKLDSQLRILSLVSENFENFDIDTTYQMVSDDGTVCLETECDTVYAEQTTGMLRIWSMGVNAEALLELEYVAEPGWEIYLYYTTPDIDYIFLLSEDKDYELWSPAEGCLLKISPGSERTTSALSVSEDGSLLAVAYGESISASRYVEVYDSHGNLLTEYEMSEDFGGITHLEFEGTTLLISSAIQSQIVDTTGESEPILISGGNMSFQYDYLLTSDGLLLCTSRSNDPYYLDAIYDIATGEKIFDNYVSAFQYNENTGILVYHDSNLSDYSTVVHVACRDQDGIFSDMYTIAPDGVNLMLKRGLQCLDDTYFLVAGDDQCQVYEIATGNKVLTLEGEDFLLCGGIIYDQRFQTNGTFSSYAILDEIELLKRAENILTSEYGIRTLNENEKEKYFIVD